MPDDVTNRLQELESSHLAVGAQMRWVSAPYSQRREAFVL